MPDNHEPRYPPSGCIGIGRSGPFDAEAFEAAVGALLSACGVPHDSVHTGRTARRVRELWQKRLLGGYDLDPAEASPDSSRATSISVVCEG